MINLPSTSIPRKPSLKLIPHHKLTNYDCFLFLMFYGKFVCINWCYMIFHVIKLKTCDPWIISVQIAALIVPLIDLII